MCAESFPHAATDLQKLETHISWVILAGEFAYKIKKPVHFDFVDYSTLALREYYCRKEIELNRRLAPELYLDVVPIVWLEDRPTIGAPLKLEEPLAGEPPAGETTVEDSVEESRDASATEAREMGEAGEVIEYAVRMKRFNQQEILSQRLKQNRVDSSAITELAKEIAQFHQSLESLPLDHPLADIENLAADARGNFPPLEAAAGNNAELGSQLQSLRQWTNNEYRRLHSEFQSRLRNGLIRRCHGDLHTNNIVWIDGRLVVFDGIEFNEELQWIDCQSEVAFLVMDLIAHGQEGQAFRLLSIYLEETGDYDGLPILRFYMVYRAMVRAKVTWLASDANVLDEANQDIQRRCHLYLDTASRLSRTGAVCLAITHGFSGSGKSTRAMEWAETRQGIRIRSDVERVRLSQQNPETEKYSPAMNDLVYRRLLEIARKTLKCGYPVVADATFIRQSYRQAFRNLAAEYGITFEIIDCQAPVDELTRRISQRSGDVSEATLDVLQKQIANHDPLTEQELAYIT